MASYEINRLIQNTCRTPAGIARVNESLDAVLEEYRLTPQERQALRDGTLEAMGKVGVHPILQIHWLLARTPEMRRQMSIRDYKALLQEK